MGDPLPISEAELQAHVDGRLTGERRAAVESWLIARPDVGERIAEYRQLGEALRATYSELVDDTVPLRLERVVGKQRPRRTAVAYLAAGIALGAALGAAAAWQMLDWPAAADLIHSPGSKMVRDAALAHAVYSPELAHPVEMGADQKAQLLAWLSKRLGMKVEAPELEAAGMSLLGGRLLPGKSRPAAMLMYETRDGRRATLYWVPDVTRERETELLYSQHNSVRVFYWVDSECGYALASHDLGKEELARLARMAHDQLEK
jgi:anti-sigma factor RsiW